MSPRRRLRANRQLWRARERDRAWRSRMATDLALVLATQGNCAVPDNGWDAAEAAYASASNNLDAATAAESVLWRCEGCPVISECAQRATIDRYTGLAAGSAWVRGQEYDPTRTINNPRAKNAA